MISHAELSELVESERATDEVRYKAGLLLSACEDWPAFGVCEPQDFIQCLRAEIGAELRYEAIHAALSSCVEIAKESSFTSVLELFRASNGFNTSTDLFAIATALTEEAKCLR